MQKKKKNIIDKIKLKNISIQMSFLCMRIWTENISTIHIHMYGLLNENII